MSHEALDQVRLLMERLTKMEPKKDLQPPRIYSKPDPSEEQHLPEEPVLRCPYCYHEVKFTDSLAEGQGFPISEDYLFQGLVEDCGELQSLWSSLVDAYVLGKVEETVSLESGNYQIVGTKEDGFRVVDPVKGFFYLVEVGRTGELTNVAPDDLFVWVLRNDNPDGEPLGYIFNGWVFAHKEVIPE